MQHNNSADVSAEAAAAAVGVTTAPNPLGASTSAPRSSKPKKPKKKTKEAPAAAAASAKEEGAVVRKKARKVASARSTTRPVPAAAAAVATQAEGLSAAQQAVQEQMRRALEEDQYSAVGSILDTESDEEDHTYNYRGKAVRLDKAALQQAVRKYNLLERLSGGAALPCASSSNGDEDEEDEDREEEGATGGRSRNNSSKAKKKKKRKDEISQLQDNAKNAIAAPASKDPLSLDAADDDLDRDGGSIFGATTGSSNSTWVECDKCKKWRRLRGVVDEKKLPSKWYCSMNKNDPERARCSAPEEEYETQHTPESAADARTRKHLRVWVRRLQCNEAYEARQPTLTRGKKRAVSSSSKDPYEWVRCCNPSCGKWRAVLRIMDAKTSVIDRTADGKWYCVMNNWDEKAASCAAPQENLPAVGCPPWVMQDDC